MKNISRIKREPANPGGQHRYSIHNFEIVDEKKCKATVHIHTADGPWMLFSVQLINGTLVLPRKYYVNTRKSYFYVAGPKNGVAAIRRKMILARYRREHEAQFLNGKDTQE